MISAKGLALVSALALLAACASTPPPTPQMTQSKAAIRAAEEVGAQRTPQAALHLKMAQDQVNTAETLVRKGDNKEAALVLNRATADAELALTLAREAATQREAAEAMRRVDELRDTIERAQE